MWKRYYNFRRKLNQITDFVVKRTLKSGIIARTSRRLLYLKFLGLTESAVLDVLALKLQTVTAKPLKSGISQLPLDKSEA